MTYGIYIHIPFCRGKCDYCSFYSMPRADVDETHSLFDAYAEALERDIFARTHVHGGVVDSIYFGGGTPSFFGSKRIASLLNVLRECFNVTSDAEISIECNPGDITDEILYPLIESGINRVTVGVQTFHERLRKIIGRFPALADGGLLERFMRIGDIVHGIDIMAGIPGSTDEELQSDLQRVVSFHPEHISVYLLTLEKDTPLWMRVKNDEEFQNAQRSQFLFVMDYLQSAGYRQYEISNYCAPGFESRHNLKYWKFSPYLGFGAAAHGFTGNTRYYNNQNVSEYIANPQYIEDVRSHHAAMAEFIMTGLRLLDGFSEADFIKIFGSEIPSSVRRALEQLIAEKLILRDHTNGSVHYALSREGIFISDSVIYRCVESLL